MEQLTIRLLGSPEVTVGQRPLAFPTRKVLALLVYLVAEGGRTNRESLTTLLWPESAPEKATITLRGALSRLRQALRPAGEYILTEGATVAFDFSQEHILDLAWLAASAQAEVPAKELSPILSLDRGDFLEGFNLPDAPGFDTWAATQREACQRQGEMVYDRLSQHLLATHNSASAADTAARWVARAPLSEQAYRRLMAAQALSGQRSAALQTYQRLKEAFQQELDLEPSRETAVLADNIGRGHVEEERPDPSSTIITGRSEVARQRLVLPLVGRSDEHGRLVAALQRAGLDGAQVMAVVGAAGVGKTRLIGAFREWAKLESSRTEFWRGRAFETGGRLAYQPVVEALRPRLEEVNAPEDLLEDVWLAELSQLIPELRARYPDLPPPLTGDAHFIRARLFEAVALLGNALAEGRTAVLVMDDLQWADTDTLDLILYLARRWTKMGAPIMLLLSVRQEAYASNAAFREWLTSLGRDTPMTRLLLENLGGAAVEHLVNRLAEESNDNATTASTSAFAAWLWAETSGLPFFIDALLQMLVEQDILPVIDQGQPTYDFSAAIEHVRSLVQALLPPGVREVIQVRLGQHSKEEGALLLAAAVLGRTCTFERLCQVADLSETDALEALEALLDGRLLVERPSHRRPYTLAHDYIREVVYSESREARRRVFHRRALLSLEAADAPATECAFHALAALLDEPAFRYAVVAGHEAFASYATQEALAHFDTARDVASRMQNRGESIDADLLGRMYRERGQALELVNDDEGARDNYEEMRAVAVQRHDRTLELAALISLSTLYGYYTSMFNPPKARERALEALALARETRDKAAEAGALWALMMVEFTNAGDNNLVMEHGQQALSLARELGLKELEGRIVLIICWPFFVQKQLGPALEALREAQLIWSELGNLPRVAEASRFMLIINYAIGDHERTLVQAPELVRLGESIGSRVDEGQGWSYLALAHARQGRFKQALDSTEKVGAISAAIGHINEEHGHQWVRIGVYLALGALEEAERWADRLYANRETINPLFVQFYLTQVALAKIASGRLEEARAILDEQLSTLPEDSHTVTTIAVAYGHLNLAQRKPEQLFTGLEERVRPYREAGFRSLLADEYWLRGRAEIALGHYDVAQEALSKARETAETQEERAILWKILATCGGLEELCGNEVAAERLRDRARSLICDIAEHAGEMRDVFLDQPAVAQLLAPT